VTKSSIFKKTANIILVTTAIKSIKLQQW